MTANRYIEKDNNGNYLDDSAPYGAGEMLGKLPEIIYYEDRRNATDNNIKDTCHENIRRKRL